MAVNEAGHAIGRIKKVRSKIRRFLQRHMTAGAVRLGFIRIIKAARAMAGNTAKQISVVMILTAQKFLIMIQLAWNADLVAGRAKLGRPHEWFEKCFLMKLRLRFDQLLVDVLQHAIRAVGEGVMDRFVDRVIGVAFGAVDVGDRVARRAGDAGLRSWMIYVVKIGIVERAAEERHHIVAAGAPARGFHAAIPFKRDSPRLAHAEEVGFIVERAEMMRAVKPAVICVLMAVQAVAIHH